MWDDQKISYKKWLASKKLEDKTAYKSTFNNLYCQQQHMQCRGEMTVTFPGQHLQYLCP